MLICIYNYCIIIKQTVYNDCCLQKRRGRLKNKRKGYCLDRVNELIKRVRLLRPIDDAMFKKLAESREVCQEILRVILDDKKLIVEEVISEDSIANIFGRAVILDALCTLGNGTMCNIEIQKENVNDDVKRVRYNASSIVSRFSEKGQKFSEIPDVIVVYISEYDVFRLGRTIYHIDSVIRETNTTVDDGLSRVFVNTQYADTDNTDVGELMKCFLQKEIDNDKFPELSDRLSYFKNDGKGVDSMCDIIKDYAKEYAKEYAEEEKAEMLIKHVDTLVETTGSVDKACELLKITRKQYEAAKALIEKTLTV